MPRRFRRKVQKKKVRKRRKAPQASLSVARIGYSSGNNFLPERFVAKMKWNKSFAISAGTSDIANIQSFLLTGMFDPEVAVSSAIQPRGFDQLGTYYSHYLVKSAKVKLTYIHKAGNPTICGGLITRNGSSTAWSFRDYFLNAPESRYKILANSTDRGVVNLPHYNKNTIYGNAQNSNLIGTPSTNPSEAFYLHTYNINAAPGDSQASLFLLVEIDYVAEWSERAVLEPSL